MASTGRTPNIVIVNPDQMRGDYMTPAGHPFIETGNLTRLAGMGTYFSRAFYSCPMCGPSRVSFVTGQYPCEHKARKYAGDMDPAHPNALTTLGRAGYHHYVSQLQGIRPVVEGYVCDVPGLGADNGQVSPYIHVIPCIDVIHRIHVTLDEDTKAAGEVCVIPSTPALGIEPPVVVTVELSGIAILRGSTGAVR